MCIYVVECNNLILIYRMQWLNQYNKHFFLLKHSFLLSAGKLPTLPTLSLIFKTLNKLLWTLATKMELILLI